jgi:hypothetical protein
LPDCDTLAACLGYLTLVRETLRTILSDVNTNAFAKAGIVLRAGTDPSAASAILDVKPDGGVEFMARQTAGASTVFIGGSAPSSLPRQLFLSRNGSTVTGWVVIDGTFVMVGTVDIPAFISRGLLAGLAVTSHDTDALNTSTFATVSVTVGAPLRRRGPHRTWAPPGCRERPRFRTGFSLCRARGPTSGTATMRSSLRIRLPAATRRASPRAS